MKKSEQWIDTKKEIIYYQQCLREKMVGVRYLKTRIKDLKTALAILERVEHETTKNKTHPAI